MFSQLKSIGVPRTYFPKCMSNIHKCFNASCPKRHWQFSRISLLIFTRCFPQKVKRIKKLKPQIIVLKVFLKNPEVILEN